MAQSKANASSKWECRRRVSLVLMLGSKVVAMGKALTGMDDMLDEGVNVRFVRAVRWTEGFDAVEGGERRLLRFKIRIAAEGTGFPILRGRIY